MSFLFGTGCAQHQLQCYASRVFLPCCKFPSGILTLLSRKNVLYSIYMLEGLITHTIWYNIVVVLTSVVKYSSGTASAYKPCTRIRAMHSSTHARPAMGTSRSHFCVFPHVCTNDTVSAMFEQCDEQCTATWPAPLPSVLELRHSTPTSAFVFMRRLQTKLLPR